MSHLELCNYLGIAIKIANLREGHGTVEGRISYDSNCRFSHYTSIKDHLCQMLARLSFALIKGPLPYLKARRSQSWVL